MARNEALIPLTHDHHHFLMHVRRMLEAASEDDAAHRRAADDFVSYYLGKGPLAMREELGLFFPAAFRDGRAHELGTKGRRDV